MDETETPPPHAGERLTREDVLRLIEEHDSPAGLDLRRTNLQHADLSGLDLHEANLRGAHLFDANLQGARLRGAYLQGADLMDANLQGAYVMGAHLQGADLTAANFQGAILHWAHLRGAKLPGGNLRGAELFGADLRLADLQAAHLEGAKVRHANLRRADLREADLRDANLENANWGDYVLGDEIQGDFYDAASAYRALKQRHSEAGMYAIAGVFHYREMEARRKLAWKEHRLPDILGLNLFRLLYGYGERPERVIVWAAAIVFGLALLVHWPLGTVEGGFWDALYYSAVSFTALGYGASASDPQGWAGRFLGAAESFMGVFMMALFLVTFTRKMTR